MKYFVNHVFLITILLVNIGNAMSQVTIKGPTCVIPGTVYQYDIASMNDTSEYSICVSGGAIISLPTLDSCTQYKGLPPFIKITWNNSFLNSINIQGSSSTAALIVNITSPLVSGLIDTTLQYKEFDYNSIPMSLSCTPDIGGSCSPVYNYQWQISDDGLIFSDLEDYNDAVLTFKKTIVKTSYFRRKVTETSSGSIAYSNTVLMVVNQPVNEQ